MLHPNCSALGFYEDDLESWRGPAGQLIHSLQFYETDKSRGFVRGCKMHVLPTPGPLNAIEGHRQLDFDELWGPAVHEVARQAQNGILWAANTEDLPEPDNRVTLSPDLVDSDGLPAPKVEYRISENTRAMLKFTVDRMVELHEAAGAVKIITQELWVDQPGHLLGTARMGDDPATSVVDSYGKAHDVDNLYIADGSIFVTSGSANPTCTISALALRVGKKVVTEVAARKAHA
jgi:choline dehydrogenase-like flavoprotein